MSKQSEAVKLWRKRTKDRLIEAFGNCCGICGYNKCSDALDFHHLDPNEKDPEESNFRRNVKSWERIFNEVKKCIMVCSNCHREIHNGITIIPENVRKIDNNYLNYKQKIKENKLTFCPICNNKKIPRQKTCSLKCSKKLQNINKYGDSNLLELYEKYKNYEVIGKMFNVTGAAIKKQITKQQKVLSSS